MKKLPKIYKNEITKKINNNKEVCYLKNEQVSDMTHNSKKDIELTLDEIFSGIGYSYNIPVTIKTSTKTYETSLITKTKNNVITLDNDIISIEDIICLEINSKKNKNESL